MRVTIDHVKAYGYCAKGARAFFIKYHLDWPDFLKNGISSEQLLATHNALAIALVNALQEDSNNGHG